LQTCVLKVLPTPVFFTVSALLFATTPIYLLRNVIVQHNKSYKH
jgi:hypothetical protein